MENTAQAPSAVENTTQEPTESNPSTPGQAAAPGVDIKAIAAEAKRKFKIDDQEVDEDEVLKVYKERKGHQRVATKELQEGRAAKKQAEEFVKMMKDKSKLIDVLYKLGYDKQSVRQLSEEYLAAELQEEMMDPRERELKEAKTKLKQYEELERRQKEEREKRAHEAMKKKFADEYSTQFVDALKQTGLPPTKTMVAEMAKYIHRAAGLNFELSAIEAAKLVREDMENHYRSLYGEADPETLVKLLGETGLQKVRTYDTQRLKDPNANLRKPGIEEQADVKRKEKTVSRMSEQQWRAFNRK